MGYKNAVKTVYERQLLEAQTEAQQDPQYLLRGDVSSFVAAALKHGSGIGNGNGNGTESNINDRKLKNFTLHNLVQFKKNLF